MNTAGSLLRAGTRAGSAALPALRTAGLARWRIGYNSSAAPISSSTQSTPELGDRPIIAVDMPLEFTKEHQQQVAPLMRRLANLTAVCNMVDGNECVREEFHWPAGMSRMIQAPETLVYGALATIDDFPLVPLVFRWRGGYTPSHLDATAYGHSFKEHAQREQSAKLPVPGLSMIQYLGEGLKFKSTVADRGPGTAATVHPGVTAALLDDITARVSFSNAPDKATFTANLQLDYLEPVRGGMFVVLNAWVTATEGRKTFVAAHLADALSGQILVRARSFWCSGHSSLLPYRVASAGRPTMQSGDGASTEYPWLRQQRVDGITDGSRDASDALGILATPTLIPSRHTKHQQFAAAGTPDSMVLDRMLELESVIATVKSSLDNHASSYYSVASQIAELNARIGHMSIGSKHDEASSSRLAKLAPASPSPQPRPSNTCSAHNEVVVGSVNADRPSTKEGALADTSDRESSDEHYTRIQEMINSLIKDADQALHSKPEQPHSRDPIASPDQLSSVSTVFDEHPAGGMFSGGCARKPALKVADCLSDFRYPRPASALGSSPRLSRSHKQKPYATAARLPAGRVDPEEADAESDSQVGAMSSFGRHHGRHATRQHRMHCRGNSGSYSDRHAGAQWSGRQRSDTIDSFLSNSSETCVSPSNRVSREFYRPSLPSQAPYAQSHVLADSLCTPTRTSFGFEEAGHDSELFMSSRLHGGSKPNVHQFPALPHDEMHQHSQQWLDVHDSIAERSPYHHHHYHPQRQALFNEDRELESPTAEGSRGNVPLIRRLRNSVTRAVLRSASFVDESINDDIAAHAHAARLTPTDTRTGRPSFRARSNTSISELSTVVSGPLSGVMSSQCESPMSMTMGGRNISSTGSPMMYDGIHWNDHASMQQVDNARDFVPRSLPPASQSPSLWTRRQIGGGEHARCNSPVSGLQVDRSVQLAAVRANVPSQVAGSTNCHIRLPDSIEEYDSSCECKSVQQSPVVSHDGDLALHVPGDSGASGLVSMISLLYWTLLFTLGALMLDSFLCQVAGKRVMGTVDKIAQIEADADNNDGTERDAEAQNRRRRLDERMLSGDGANVANTVGRFVRWYIDGPEDPLPATTRVSGPARSPAHSLRARKSQSLRGSFKHIG
ncbi:hypothetical protein GGI20_005647 [Coemansia sp. BCRC 34301]|nr:hypothetical protein GGI20_005647 [Coemansia sp. BCRC 34301]